MFNRLTRLILLLPLTLSGCQALGLIAAKAPPRTVQAAYSGLVNQKVGTITWADSSITRDFPNIQQDLSGGVQAVLKDCLVEDPKMKELQGVTFADVRTLRRFQKDHPELDSTPIPEIAPRLGVTRLIYVQIDDFQTRASNAFDLFRGSMKATVKIVEVNGDKAKEVYSDSGISVTFPKYITNDGTPNGSDDAMYIGTLRAAAEEISKRFVPHPEGDDE